MEHFYRDRNGREYKILDTPVSEDSGVELEALRFAVQYLDSVGYKHKQRFINFLVLKYLEGFKLVGPAPLISKEQAEAIEKQRKASR